MHIIIVAQTDCFIQYGQIVFHSLTCFQNFLFEWIVNFIFMIRVFELSLLKMEFAGSLGVLEVKRGKS
jgi:hypothetical protein